jgi:type I restriction enzyme S subunit
MAKLKSPDQSVVLLIHSDTGSGLPVHRIADFLNTLEEAYNAPSPARSSRARQAILTGPFGAELGAEDFVEEGVPVLQIGNVQAGYVDQSNLLFVSEQKAAGLSRYRVHAGDLLFARQGATTGRNSLASSREDGFLINYHIIRVAIDPGKCSSTFLYAAFNSEKVQSQVEKEKGKGTREGVNTATLMAFVLPIPPLAEQMRLSDVIDAHRQQTENVVSQCNKLRALKTALMHALRILGLRRYRAGLALAERCSY